MDYQTFTSTELIPRIQTALNGLKTALVAAGVAVGNITVSEVQQGNIDLRYRIVATKASKTFTAYLELTASIAQINGEATMVIVITLWADGNGSQIVSSYTPGPPQAYNSSAGIDALLVKLTTVEGVVAGELKTAARAFLGV